MSGNMIGDLDEIRALSVLDRLRTLQLSDPHFGDNPVCALCNYRTLLIHDLPGIQLLDSEQITDEDRAAAHLVYTKKVMYVTLSPLFRCLTVRYVV